jgi:cytochrome c peroxidase
MKMYLSLYRLLALLFVSILLCSCKKDEQAKTPPWETGPYAISIPKHFGDYRLPEDNPLTKEGIALGRMLFYEKKLSNNNTISCGSCHQQKFAFSDDKVFSTGSEGIMGKRNSMSLANLIWAKNFFWDGRAKSLEEQALIPIQDPLEMHQTLDEAVAKLQNTAEYPKLFKLVFGSEQITAQNIAKALAQFERTLISSDSKFDRFLQNKYTPTVSEFNGKELFFTHPEAGRLRGGNCLDCHGGNLTMLNTFHNNGLDANPTDPGREGVTGQSFDIGKFKAPSLRNIALTAPYMHDGRFETLEEVLDHYNDHIQRSQTLDPLILEASNEPILAGGSVKLHLTTQEKKDIIAFLHMLTDSTFIQNKAFSNPFEQK